MEQIEIKDPYGFIYITTNMINGKRYIGQKKFMEGKWKYYIGSGRHFLNAVKKYGKENFIRNIVDIAYSLEELNEKEKEWIDNYNAVESDDYYNMTEGGNTCDHLVKAHSIPIICLNNRMVFNSIKEASDWSGHTLQTIKNTYDLDFNKNKHNKLIFRPLEKYCSKCNELFYSSNKKAEKCAECGGYVYCVDCENEFVKNSNRQIRCEDCAKNKRKIDARLRVKKHRKKSNMSEEKLNNLIEKEREKALTKNKIRLEPAKKRTRVKIEQFTYFT